MKKREEEQKWNYMLFGNSRTTLVYLRMQQEFLNYDLDHNTCSMCSETSYGVA
jgi:hypothetical protein